MHIIVFNVEKHFIQSINGMTQMTGSEFPHTYFECCQMLRVGSHQKLMFRIHSRRCWCQIRKFSFRGLKLR